MRSRQLKIRHKIILWITSVGLIVTMFFAGYTLHESIELSYEIMDEDLKSDVQEDLKSLEMEPHGRIAEVFDTLLDFDESHWIKVFDDQMNLVYSSTLSGTADIPFEEGDSGYNYQIQLPRPAGDDGRQPLTVVRVNVFDIQIGDRSYKIQIAKDIKRLEKEVDELVSIVVVGFLLASVLLIVLSYFLTGKILEPIININRLTGEISATRLNRRIPLGKSKDEIYILSQSLNSMFDRLQQAFDMQKQFTADAAHELKTPITMLHLFMDQSLARQDLPQDYIRQLLSQMDILRRMRRMVKQLLDLSALDLKEHLQLEVFELSSMLHQVLEDFDIVFSSRNISLETGIPPGYPYRGDRDKLSRMFINLIDNAVKYNQDGGKIVVKLAEKNGWACISVWNSGPGIPDEDLPHVFDTFFRVDKSRSKTYGGSGLGLAIVKSIVQLHRGTVSMESQAGHWCLVTVHLPLNQ